MIDDTIGKFTPILKITKQAYSMSQAEFKGNLLTFNVSNPSVSHTINFSYKLRRFPKKVKTLTYQDKATFLKQFTSSTSDIISFKYESVSVEFGAMRPFANKRIKISSVLSGNNGYKDDANYSLACFVNRVGARSFSIYTDYNLEQGKTYSVSVEFINGEVSLIVNGVRVPTAFIRGRVWDKKFNNIRKPSTVNSFKKAYDLYEQGVAIASQPGFKTAGFPAIVNDITGDLELNRVHEFPKDLISPIFKYLDVYHYERHAVPIPLEFNTLLKIESVPYEITTLPIDVRLKFQSGSLSVLNDDNQLPLSTFIGIQGEFGYNQLRYNFINQSKYYTKNLKMRKINNGIEIGNIEIFSGVKPIKERY